jgi:hypothetical protein
MQKGFWFLELNGTCCFFTTADVKNDEYIDQKTLAVGAGYLSEAIAIYYT